MSEINTPAGNPVIEKIRALFAANRKMLTYSIGGLVIIFGGYFGYRKFVTEPRNKKGFEQMWKADYYFEIDSFNLAINGDNVTGMPGYKTLVKKYSGTQAGNLASYCLGISYLNTGEYKKAIEALEACDFDDNLVSSVAIGAQGDAYMELNKINEAIDKYTEAANRSENDFTTPVYLKKAAMACELKGQYKKAAELFERLWRDFDHTTEGRDAEKYLARAQNLGGKK